MTKRWVSAVGLAGFVFGMVVARPARGQADSSDDQVFGAAAEQADGSVRAARRRMRQEQARAVPFGPQLTSLELSIFYPWTGQRKKLSVVPFMNTMTLTLENGNNPAETRSVSLTPERWQKIQQLWGAVKDADGGSHPIYVPVADANEFTLSYAYKVITSNPRRITVAGSISGPMVPQVWSGRWASARPLVGYLLEQMDDMSKASLEDVVVYSCTPHGPDSGILVGSQIDIVKRPEDGTSGPDANLYVRTVPVVPQPTYSYELLTRRGSRDGKTYESEHYFFTKILPGFSRVRLEYKGSKAYADCIIHAVARDAKP